MEKHEQWINVTDKKLTLIVEKNKVWTRNFTNINIMVTDDIFNEIRQYVNQKDDIIMVEDSGSGDKLIFKLEWY